MLGVPGGVAVACGHVKMALELCGGAMRGVPGGGELVRRDVSAGAVLVGSTWRPRH